MFYIFSWGVDCVPELEFVQIETVVIEAKYLYNWLSLGQVEICQV